MTNNSLTLIVQHLRAAVRDGTGRTDGELLTHFLSRRDEDALATLVERHAPMVWGVCRRVLRNQHEAEDAFQATFLVLVQKAASVVPPEMVANWLHGVAQQTAVRLRATAAKRGWREVQMDVMPEPAVAEASDEELLSRLDEELSRLPERCRVLIVLCDLEGHTRKEVARQLGCPEGTVASGLARARELLAKRLTRRGLVVSGGSLAATLSHSMASADVSATVVTSTINVATLLAAGKAAGVISGPVATLTQGVLKTMFLKKILTTTMAVLALGVAVLTCGSLAVGQTEGKPSVGNAVKAPVAEKPVQPATKQENSSFNSRDCSGKWRGEKDGMKVELVFTGEDDARWVIRMKGVQIEADLKRGEVSGGGIVTEDDLKPAAKAKVYLRFGTKENPTGTVVGTVERGDGGSLSLDILPAATEIWTYPRFGTVTGCWLVKVDDEEPGKKEAFTVWGKESGGLRAGLGLLPGAKRVYKPGETVTLVVRVRNVGKQAVRFEYVRQFLDENRPTVTDAEGKNLAQSRTEMLGTHGPTEVNLEPGKEIVLETRIHGASGSPYALLPEDGGLSSAKVWPLFVGRGKVSLHYDAVFGNSSSGKIKLDPDLAKLATGKLELEVKEPEKVPQDKKEAFTAAPVPKEKAKTNYWPRRVGDKWVYTHGEREVSREVARVTEKDGETRVTTTHTDGTVSREIEYLVKGGAVYQTKAGPYTFDPPIRYVDIDLKAGAKWESKTPLTEGVLGNSGEMVVGEEEEVKVPAGTFKAVPVVYTVTEVDGKPIPKPTVYTCWYAAGVGLVKLKCDGREMVLKAFTPADPKPEAK
jgi:RNA polymerase sigma factor (sigma-70 family)